MSNFKEGDIVICIKGIGGIYDDILYYKDKSYRVTSVLNSINIIYIKSEDYTYEARFSFSNMKNNHESKYYYDYFITLKEHRKLKLKRIEKCEL